MVLEPREAVVSDNAKACLGVFLLGGGNLMFWCGGGYLIGMSFPQAVVVAYIVAVLVIAVGVKL